MSVRLIVQTDNGLTLHTAEVRPKPRQSDEAAERELHAKLREQFPGRRIFYERSGAAVPSAPPANTRRMVEWSK